MKNWGIFFGGLGAGVVLTLLVIFLIGLGMNASGGLSGAKMFDKPGPIVHERSFKVLQVVQDNAALVYAKSDTHLEFYMEGPYLLINHDGTYYYDDQKIKVPTDKVVRQVGIYKYEAKSGDHKTVPIIEIR